MDSRWLGSPRLQTTSRSTSKSSCTSPLKKPATARHGTSGSIALCPRLSRWLDHAADYNSRTSASCGNEDPKGIRSSRFVHRSAARDPAEDVLQEGQVGPKTCLHSTCVTLCAPARKAGCRQFSGTASTRRPRRFRTSTCTYLGPSPPFRAARSLGGRHRYVHSHRPAPWNLTFDCRESRGGYGTDYGLVGFDQGVRTNPFPVRLRQRLSIGPGLRPSAHTWP